MQLNCKNCGRLLKIKDESLISKSEVVIVCPICKQKFTLSLPENSAQVRNAQDVPVEPIDQDKQKPEKFLSIKWRFALSYGFFLLLSFSVLFFSINTLFHKNSNAELDSRALTVARSFMASGTTPILGHKMDVLNKLVRDMLRLDPDIVYLFAELPEYRVLSHNLAGGMPAALLKPAQMPSGKEYHLQQLHTDQIGIHEAVMPLLGNRGVVRVGISDQRIMQNFRKNQMVFLVVMITSLFLGITISVFLARQLTKPLIYLTDAADQISMGNLEITIIPFKKRDEIKMLADAFERLRESFSIAMRRLSAK